MPFIDGDARPTLEKVVNLSELIGVTNAGVSTLGRNEASASCAGHNIHTVPATPMITPARTIHVRRRSVLARMVSNATRHTLRMFEVRHLTKRYPRITALNDVSFHIARGEILGYLGPNGSGKSTTIKIITGLIDPSDGQVFLDGQRVDEDPPAFRARLGYVPEEPYLYTHLTAPEYLRLVGRLRGMAAAPLDARH